MQVVGTPRPTYTLKKSAATRHGLEENIHSTVDIDLSPKERSGGLELSFSPTQYIYLSVLEQTFRKPLKVHIANYKYKILFKMCNILTQPIN